MVYLKINEIYYCVKEGISILEACNFLGIQVPRFCYHETLSVVGSCRMCLIKFEQDDKLYVSCVTEVANDMEILTEDPLIKKARENILEFLLVDHPLDCPICDQGNECDLQDQVKKFGISYNKFYSNKMSVEDKNFNYFIKSIMTRCIHCTRCVRFSTEIAGVDFFGTLGRGNSTEIGTYGSSYFNSEIAGSVIDLCPVGALTSKTFAFKDRRWSLDTVESIDKTDGLGSNIYKDYSRGKLLRIRPKYNAEINENLISDKARFYFDSLDYSILNSSPKLEFDHLYKFYISKNKKILFIINDDLSLEIISYLKTLESIFPDLILIRSSLDNQNLETSNFFINNSLDVSSMNISTRDCFLFAVDPRTEAALINKRLRDLNLYNDCNFYSVGYKYESTLNAYYSNINFESMLLFFEGKIKFFSKRLITSTSPIFIFGTSLLKRGFNLKLVQNFFLNLNRSGLFYHISLFSNTFGLGLNGILSVTLKDVIAYQNDLVIFVNCNDTIFLRKFFLKFKNLNYIWVNTHLSNFFDVKKTFSFFEQLYDLDKGVFINLEGRPQGYLNKEDLDLILNKYNSSKIKSLNTMVNLQEYHLEIINMASLFLKNIKKKYISETDNSLSIVNKNLISSYPTKPSILDFYCTDTLTRFSTNLSQARKFLKNNFF
jgi:hypothetical protein